MRNELKQQHKGTHISMENRTKLAFLWMQIQFTCTFFVGIDAEFPPYKHTQNSRGKNRPCVTKIQMNHEQQDLKRQTSFNPI
jgi:hypothetical protein